MSDPQPVQCVFVTGATGFVGRNVVRELLARGITPVCLVRDPRKLFRQHSQVDPDRFRTVLGSLSDRTALLEGASQAQAAIHLVGIIIARRLRGQTFRKVHVDGTVKVIDALRVSGVRRYVHMSALGARPDAVSAYHRTKWRAEEYVRESGLDWTIFRPSLIHGPDGEFVQLIKKFVCGLVPPVIPYFGAGTGKLQPVYVKDVAHCIVDAIFRPETIRQVVPLGGPRAYSWIELYNACRAMLPGARNWKPLASLPVPVARLVALLSAPPMALAELIVPSVGLLRFDRGQVAMAQEDATCDHAVAEKLFGIKMCEFEAELSAYADLIR
jgi:NADH dehydrogenase